MKRKLTPLFPITYRPISLPTNTHNITLYDKLTKLGIPILQTTSQTIKNPTNIIKRTHNETPSHAGIYSIACKDCNKHYISENQRNLETRIYEHKRSIKTNDDRNALFSHMLELKNSFNFSQAALIKPIHGKTSRRLQESVVILNKPYKTTTRFLTNLITPGEHHIERKQNQNIKWIGKKKAFFQSVPTYFWKSFVQTILTANTCEFKSHGIHQLQPRHHNIDNFLRHHIIGNIFSMKQVMPKSPFK